MNKYVIVCLRHRDMYFGGDAYLFWGPDGNGYTAVLETAGLYDREEAAKIASGTHGQDVPIEISQLCVTEAFFQPGKQIKELPTITLVNKCNEEIKAIIHKQIAEFYEPSTP